MKKITTLLLLVCFCMMANAQRKMINVIDEDTKEPIDKVLIIHGKDTLTRTTPQGIAVLSTEVDSVTFVHPEYKPKTIAIANMPAVVRLKGTGQHIQEIEVVGEEKKHISNEDFKRMKRERALQKANPTGGGLDLLDVYNKVTKHKTKKELRAERLKKTLEAYEEKEEKDTEEE
ncbi:MAG: hypothetical protein KBT34_04495 [Prevotella sp.]|nr:hypothetical protein [Candidatus Prevotella equi]